MVYDGNDDSEIFRQERQIEVSYRSHKLEGQGPNKEETSGRKVVIFSITIIIWELFASARWTCPLGLGWQTKTSVAGREQEKTMGEWKNWGKG